MTIQSDNLPVISVASLLLDGADAAEASAAISSACRDSGFFYIVDHGVERALIEKMESLSHEFFTRPLDEKMQIRMAIAGRAWRGYFPVGAELTSGQPDQKEGLYFGAELSASHPKVASGTPLHGANLFPQLAEFKETVLRYLDRMTTLGHALMKGLALSLNIDAGWFEKHLTTDPLILFRIFHYPSIPEREFTAPTWSVGEHTDYGLLTILRQDKVGGLQIKTQGDWVEAPPIDNSFVCNIGDMLERMTGGLYRSTPHRVLNRSTRARLSFPFFFDPNWDAEITPIHTPATTEAESRWDEESVFDFSGTYGEYILRKVGRVFPDLKNDNI